MEGDSYCADRPEGEGSLSRLVEPLHAQGMDGSCKRGIWRHIIRSTRYGIPTTGYSIPLYQVYGTMVYSSCTVAVVGPTSSLYEKVSALCVNFARLAYHTVRTGSIISSFIPKLCYMLHGTPTR